MVNKTLFPLSRFGEFIIDGIQFKNVRLSIWPVNTKEKDHSPSGLFSFALHGASSL